MVPLSDLLLKLGQSGHGQAPLLQISGPAPGPLRHGGRQEYFELSIGEDGCANVTALGHQPTALAEELLLPRQRKTDRG